MGTTVQLLVPRVGSGSYQPGLHVRPLPTCFESFFGSRYLADSSACLLHIHCKRKVNANLTCAYKRLVPEATLSILSLEHQKLCLQEMSYPTVFHNVHTHPPIPPTPENQRAQFQRYRLVLLLASLFAIPSASLFGRPYSLYGD